MSDKVRIGKEKVMAQRVDGIKHGPEITIGFTRAPSESGGFPLSHQQSATIDLLGVVPIGPDEVNKALADLEIMASLLRKYPSETAAIVNDVLAGKPEAARQTALRIGFTEEAFQQQSGGMWWAICVAAGAIFACVAFGCE
jgi:hypothetical protein